MGAFFINCIANNPKMIIGIQTAKNAGKFPNVAKTVVIFINSIKEKVIANPKARFKPMPPLTFRDDNDTPMRVKTIVANGYVIL